MWKLPTPEIIISVTGGAQALTLPAPLEEVTHPLMAGDEKSHRIDEMFA